VKAAVEALRRLSIRVLVIIGAVLALSGMHVSMRLAGQPVAVPVPVPVLIIAAELAAIGALCWLISRAVRGCPFPSLLPWRTA
jgi:hypothetical protein